MDRSLDDAFAAVPRADFLPPDQRAYAHQDRPLAIGFGATNSQPWTVRYMLRLLDARPGDRVLDVGSGSGWTAALLGWLVGEAGEVVGVDIVPELVAMAREHLAGRFGWVRFELARRGKLGWPDGAPWDRILVSAMADELPEELLAQLAPGGRLVVPVDERMVLVTLSGRGERTVSRHGAYVFVPLIRGRATP